MGERKSKNSGVARSSAQTSLSDKGTTRAPAEDEADDEEGEEDEEQDLRNFRRSLGIVTRPYYVCPPGLEPGTDRV